jgi:hypothetical protein
MKPALKTFLMAAAVTIGALSASGCADAVPTQSNACPCANGYVCCESGVCASEVATCGAATAALSIGAQGRWTGYVENAGALLVDDSLDLSLDVDANGALQGRVVFGSGPPAPPTDPLALWPEPGKGGFVLNPNDYFSPITGVQPVVGVPLTARDIRWEARRLRFRVEPVEALGSWCALQTPVQAPWGEYFCSRLVTQGGTGDDGIGRCFAGGEFGPEVDCKLAAACFTRPCDCTASGCSVRAMSYPSGFWPVFHFDIALRGDEGDGSLNTSNNVRLIRASR